MSFTNKTAFKDKGEIFGMSETTEIDHLCCVDYL